MECKAVPCIQPTLVDLIAEAQHIVTYLPLESCKALSASSRGLRTLIHSVTKLVTVKSCDDLSRLAKDDWPHLALAIYHKGHVMTPSEQKAALDLMRPLAALILLNTKDQAIVFIRPLQGQAHHRPQSSQEAIVQLEQVRWTTLEVKNSLGPTSMKYIFAMKLLHVRVLDLSSHALAAVVVAALVDHLPRLKYLRLVGCMMSSDGASKLGQGGRMYKIKHLDLSNSSCTTFAVPTLLCATDWPSLEKLNLQHVHFCGTSLADLKPIELPKLWEINLNCCGMVPSASVMDQLTKMPWLTLRKLSLSSNNLGDSAAAYLARASLPGVSEIDLSCNMLGEGAALHLVNGNWPLLEYLTLCNNNLSAAAMIVIAKGCWPKLRWLSLTGNSIGSQGVESLTQGMWPSLCYLSLDLELLLASQALYNILSLCVDCSSGRRCPASAVSLCVTCNSTRLCSPSAEQRVKHNLHADSADKGVVWPSLYSVWFWQGVQRRLE